MKPKNPKSSSSKPPSEVQLKPDASQEMQQVLTFETVEELLSYDRSETVIPDRIIRKLRHAMPGQDIMPIKPLGAETAWKPRAKD